MASYPSKPPGANPCRTCQRRTVGCHGSCPDYQAFARRRAEERAADHAAAAREWDRIEYAMDFKRRIRLHKRRER